MMFTFKFIKHKPIIVVYDVIKMFCEVKYMCVFKSVIVKT